VNYCRFPGCDRCLGPTCPLWRWFGRLGSWICVKFMGTSRSGEAMKGEKR
jgi:hypothetical protein